MRFHACWLIAVPLLVVSVQPMHAQGGDRGLVEVTERPIRAGVYVTGGLSDGMEQYKYELAPYNSYTDRLSSPAAVLRIGGTPNVHLRIGAELYGWWNSYYDDDPDIQANATETFGTFMIDGQYYPSVRSGFYVKGGVGVARSGTSYGGYYESVSETGFAWSVGAGYDFRLSRGVSIAPTVDFYQGSFSSRESESDDLGTLTEHVLNIGVSLTFQSGRRRF